MRKFIFCVTAVAALSYTSSAMAVYDVAAKPEEINAVIHATVPYGSGKVTRIGMTIYDDSLWTDSKPWSMSQPFALTLHYHMSFSAKTLVSKSLDEMQRINGLSDATLAEYGKQLASVFPDVKSGDTITALYQPGQTQFFHNGASTGIVKGDAFAKSFFGIWLSEKTSEPAARAKLLAGPVK